MKHFLILLTAFFAAYGYSSAQQSATDSVKATINQLFDAMRNADAAALQDAFSDSAVLQTIVNTKDGKTVVRNEVVKDFADFVGKTTKGDADERITFDLIRIDDNMAIAWTPYKFYYKGKYSHCGVDSFQLVRINGKWKIVYLIDTRRKECN